MESSDVIETETTLTSQRTARSTDDRSAKRSTVVILDEDGQLSCDNAFQRVRRQLSSKYAIVSDRLSDFRGRRQHQPSSGASVSGMSKQWMIEKRRSIGNAVSLATRRMSTAVGDLSASYAKREIGVVGSPPEVTREVRHLSFWHDVVGEFIGTFFLVVVGCGASVQHERQQDQERDLRITLAIGLTYASCIYCLRRGINGHFNPVVTAALTATKRFEVTRCAIFVAAQFCGAVAGAAALLKMTDGELLVGGSLGCTVPGDGIGQAKALLVEFFATLVFVFVVIAGIEGHRPKRRRQVASDRNNNADDEGSRQLSSCASRSSAASFVSGTTLISVSLMAMPYSGSGLNTARSFGPALVSNIWTSHWIYWLGTLSGGLAGGFLHDLAFLSTSSTFRKFKSKLGHLWNRVRCRSGEVNEDEETGETSRTSSIQSTTGGSTTAVTSQVGCFFVPKKNKNSFRVDAAPKLTRTKVSCHASGHRAEFSNGEPEMEKEPIVRRSTSYQSALEIDDCDRPVMKSPASLRNASIRTAHVERLITINGVQVSQIDGIFGCEATRKLNVLDQRERVNVRKDASVDEEEINPFSIATFDSDGSIDDDDDEDKAPSMSSGSQTQDKPATRYQTAKRTSPNQVVYSSPASAFHPQPPNIVLPAVILVGPSALSNHRETEKYSRSRMSSDVEVVASEADNPSQNSKLVSVKDNNGVTVNGSVASRSVSSANSSVDITGSQDNVFDPDIGNGTVIDASISNNAKTSIVGGRPPSLSTSGSVSFGVCTSAVDVVESFGPNVANRIDTGTVPALDGTVFTELGPTSTLDGEIADETSTLSSSLDDSVTDTARPVMVNETRNKVVYAETTIVMEVESTATTAATSDKAEEIREETSQRHLNAEGVSLAGLVANDSAYYPESVTEAIMNDTNVRNETIGSETGDGPVGITGVDDALIVDKETLNEETHRMDDKVTRLSSSDPDSTTVPTEGNSEMLSQHDVVCQEEASHNFATLMSCNIYEKEADISNDPNNHERQEVVDVGGAENDDAKCLKAETVSLHSPVGNIERPTSENIITDDYLVVQPSMMMEAATDRLTIEQVREVKRLIGDGVDYLDDCSPLGGAMPESEDSSADEM